MAELPELETLRRELEKESVGKRFKTPEVTGTKVAKRGGGKKVLPGPARGGQGQVGRSAGPVPGRQPRHRRAAPARPRREGPPGEGRALVPPPRRAPCSRSPSRRAARSGWSTRAAPPRPSSWRHDAVAEDAPELASIGLDPVADPVSWTSFARVLLARTVKLKALLMDPQVVAGIGPIYSDEILWEAGLRYDRISSELSSQEIRRLFRALVETLHDAVKHRGTTVDDYPVRRPLRQARRLPGRAQGVRPRRRALPPLPGARRQGALRQQARLLLRGLPGLIRRRCALLRVRFPPRAAH